MLYVLPVTVKVILLDDVMNVLLMMLHGLQAIVSCLEAPECTKESQRFLGMRKAVSDGYF